MSLRIPMMHVSGPRAVLFVPILLALAAGPASASVEPPPSGGGSEDITQKSNARMDPPRERRMGRGPLSDSDMERLITVADDISPEWASSLRERLAEDPEEARTDFRRYGRRLFGLLMLKDSNPELYKVRVAELAIKKGIRDQAARYHAVLVDDPGEAERIAGTLKQLVVQSIDLELRARALELQALDTAVREMRSRLMNEVDDSLTKADRVWQELLENPAAVEDAAGPLDGLRPGSLQGSRRRSGPGTAEPIANDPDDRG